MNCTQWGGGAYSSPLKRQWHEILAQIMCCFIFLRRDERERHERAREEIQRMDSLI
jgi:hypothetical protein